MSNKFRATFGNDILHEVMNTARSSSASTGIFEGLTARNIRESMTNISEILKTETRPRVLPDDAFEFLRVGMGTPIITSAFLPDEQPAIQVRDIRLKDGTPLLGSEFLAGENAWWREQYGMRPVAFMVGGQMAVHPKVRAIIAGACKALDDDLLRVMLGRQP